MSIDWKVTHVIALEAPRGTIDRVVVARSFYARCIGLLARSTLHEGEGMLFVPGGSVHTFGMRFAIDIVFLSERFDVLDVVEGVRPWRIALAPRHTRFVLELPTLAARQVGIVHGSALLLSPFANSCRVASTAANEESAGHRLNCDLNLTSRACVHRSCEASPRSSPR